MNLILLNRIKDYMEYTAIKIEHEWGACRSLKELIKSDDMPELYDEILREIDTFDEENNSNR